MLTVSASILVNDVWPQGLTHSHISTSLRPNAVSVSLAPLLGVCVCHSMVKTERSVPGSVSSNSRWRSTSLPKLSGLIDCRPVWLKRLNSPLGHIQLRWSLWFTNSDAWWSWCKGSISIRGLNVACSSGSVPKNCGATIKTRPFDGSFMAMKCPAEAWSFAETTLLRTWHTSDALSGG